MTRKTPRGRRARPASRAAEAFAVVTLLAILARASDARADADVDAAAAADPAAFTLPARIDAIEIHGIGRTKPFVVLRELGYVAGDVVDLPEWNLAVTRLWNTGIFARVRSELVVREGRRIAVYTLEERWTVSAIVRFATAGDTYWFRLGVAETNLLGRYLEVGGFYERFGSESGGQIYARNPRFLDRRIELLLAADRLVRPRPEFSDQRARAGTELNVLAMNDRLRYGLRVDVWRDRFLPAADGPTRLPDDMTVGSFDVGFRVGRLDTIRLRQSGASLEARPAVLVTTDRATKVVGQLTLEALAFFLLGERWNVALRARAGTQTTSPEPLRFYAGGLDYVRGVSDNFVRSRAFVLGNAELRFAAFDSKRVALMPVAFVDAVAARRDDGTRQGVVTAGGGLRILFPLLVASGLRVEGAIPITQDLPPLLSLGVFHFF